MSHLTWKNCECPHCGKLIRIENLIETKIIEAEEGNIDWRHALSKEELAILSIAEENGALAKFSHTVHIMKAGRNEDSPKSMERHFLSFIRTSAPRQIPRCALNIVLRELDYRNEKGKRVDFLCAQGIGMIIVDGIISSFVPAELLLGKSVKGARGIKAPVPEQELEDWFRDSNRFIEKKTADYNNWRAKTLKSYAVRKSKVPK